MKRPPASPITILFREAIDKTFDEHDDDGLAYAIRVVAAGCGLNERTIYRWRRKAPDFDQLLRAWALCGALGIPIEDFHAAVAKNAPKREELR